MERRNDDDDDVSEERNLYHDGIVYHAHIDENLQKLNIENMSYPGPIIPFIGYQQNDEGKDMNIKIPNAQGDNIPEIESFNFDQKLSAKIPISEKGKKGKN